MTGAASSAGSPPGVCGHVVHADPDLVAFLDRGPLWSGHLQIVPRLHVETFEALPAALAAKAVEAGQRLARAQKRLYGVDPVAFLFTGGDIAHAHAHLVPMHEKTDVTSRRCIAEAGLTFRGLPAPPEAEMGATAQDIAALLGG